MSLDNVRLKSVNLDDESIEKMKSDLYNLIRSHCRSYLISDSRYELFLHDSTRIEYDVMEIIQVERFLDLLNRYWDYFPHIISNLSFEDDSKSIELSRIVGTLHFQKTRNLRRNQGTQNVICSVNTKDIFISENILLGAVLLGINLLATKFLQQGRDGTIEEFKEFHGTRLQQIVHFTGFLLKDRTISKLVDNYLLNYENIEQLILKISSRIHQGKIRNQYRPLIKFIREWKYYDWILNEPINSLRKALTPHFDSITEDRIYEMWIFFKILTLFEPLEQKKSSGVFVNEKLKLSIEYHHQIRLGNWVLGKPEFVSNINRIPDILIKKDGKELAIMDAKCMKYGELTEEDGQEPSPDTNIVNQMLIYLDYGNCDLGIVLFADEKIRNDIVIKQNESRRLLFLNCYPFGETSIESFSKIRHLLQIS